MSAALNDSGGAAASLIFKTVAEPDSSLRDWYVQAGDRANDASYGNSFERSAA
jgi:hypothetical protein